MANEKEHTPEEEQNLAQHEQEDIESEQREKDSQDMDYTQKINAANDKYARLLAEFENYKKRTSKEKIDIIQSAGKEVIANLLPVLDDLDRALASMQQATDIEPVKQGIELVNSKFRKTLEQQGLQEMDVVGEPFDSEFQEAITTIPAPSEDLKNKVIDVIEKGYFLNGKVVRYAKVVIGQ